MRFVDMELARRLEVAGHAMPGADQSSVPAHNGKERILVGGGIAVFAGMNSPVTQAEGLGLNGPVSEEEFERLEEFFRSRGSAVFIEVCPMADATFIEALGKLEDARSAGCDLAMSITLPGSVSQRNLERQGFCVVYTRTKFVREWK
jgi:hypothetical protein